MIPGLLLAFLLGWLCGEAWEETRPRRLNREAGESAPPSGRRTDNGDAGKEHQPGPLPAEHPNAFPRFSANEVVAQFWKDEVEPKTGEPFTQDFADLLEAFALWINDTFDLHHPEAALPAEHAPPEPETSGPWYVMDDVDDLAGDFCVRMQRSNGRSTTIRLPWRDNEREARAVCDALNGLVVRGGAAGTGAAQ